MKYDLSIIIPARNEEFLAKTIEVLLENIEGNTEIIAVCDGYWPNPPVGDHEKVRLVRLPDPVGQRAAQNVGVRMSNAKYIMKMDAHCTVEKGFDKVMIEDMQENSVMVPLMKNLHAFDWVCKKCGNHWYQGSTPTHCFKDYDAKEKNPSCDSKEFKREIVWRGKRSPNSTSYRFDTTLHFQYFGEYKEKQMGDIVETMSLQGSCFMVDREMYWKLNLCDESWGSWGQQGVEVAVKTWLSGGRVLCNKQTWYAHLFRTQGGDFGFPYQQSGNQVNKAREISRDIFFNNKYEHQIYPLSWLIEKFSPVPDWTPGNPVYEQVMLAAKNFKR